MLFATLVLVGAACTEQRRAEPAPTTASAPPTSIVTTTSVATPSTVATTEVPPSTAPSSTTTAPPTTHAATTTAPPATTTPPTAPTASTTTTSPPATTTPPPSTAPATTTPPSTSPAGGPSVAVHRLPTSERVVALTLDAGSDLGYTDQVLDTLAATKVQASFGITGAFAAAHPDRVRRMAQEGHVVMNHSDSHRSFTGTSSSDVLLTSAERQADLRRADAILAPLVGRSTVPYWRPPYGDYDAGVLADVGAIGYAHTVMWTFDSLGWRGLTADQIVERVLDRVEPGAIIVMHVGSQSQDGPALRRVIDGLRADGYRFTTVANALR